MGFVGSVDEKLQLLEKHGSANQKEGLDKIKNDFMKLKNEVYTQSVFTSSKKKDIAEKVLAFYETYKDAPGAAKFCIPTNTSEALKQAVYEVSKEARADLEKDRELEEFKKETPAQYLQNILSNCEKSGNYGPFFREYADVKSKMEGDEDEAFKTFESKILRFNRPNSIPDDEEFTKEFLKAMFDYHNDLITLNAQKAEAIANDIRKGTQAVSPEMEHLKNDVYASRNIAVNMIKNHPTYRSMEAIESIQRTLAAQHGENYSKLAQIYNKQYLERGEDGLSVKEHKRLRNIKETCNHALDGQFGAKAEPTHADKTNTYKALKSAFSHIDNYKSNFHNMRNEATQRMAALTTLLRERSENSDEFTHMCDCMAAVTQLNIATTSAQNVQKALEALARAADNYTEKIARKGGGNLPAGKRRLRFAENIKAFVNQHENALNTDLGSFIAPEESINSQLNSAEERFKNYRKNEVHFNFDEYIKLKQAEAKKAYQDRDRKAMSKAVSGVISAITYKKELEKQPDKAENLSWVEVDSAATEIAKRDDFKRMMHDEGIPRLGTMVERGMFNKLTESMSKANKKLEQERAQEVNQNQPQAERRGLQNPGMGMH